MKLWAGKSSCILILSLVMNLSCSARLPEKEDFMENEANNNKRVTLTGTVKQEKDSIVISYDIKNQSNEKVLAWDMLCDTAGETIYDDLAYVSLEEPKTMRVVRAVLPLPVDRDVYMKEIPLARAIDPGASISGRIVLRMPVEEYSPYYVPATPNELKDVEVTKIHLMIGWTEVRPGMKITDAKVNGNDLKSIRGSWERPLQRIAEQDFPLPTTLKVRTDVFDRRPPETK